MWKFTRSRKMRSREVDAKKRVQFGSAPTQGNAGGGRVPRRGSSTSSEGRAVSFNQRVKVYVYQLSTDERQSKQAAAQYCRMSIAS
mmetsp:Transcript_10947/g.17938  ORF Transcript_10947/g.17938 Transcript_10947/m.17938 type:complete len:86 (-) Transcript_10947:260-517(-)